MQELIARHAYWSLIALPGVAVLGVVVAWLMPSWALLVGDVGRGGAWFIQALFQLIYALFIGFGTVGGLALLVYRNRTVSLRGTLLSNTITLVSVNLLFEILVIRNVPLSVSLGALCAAAVIVRVSGNLITTGLTTR